MDQIRRYELLIPDHLGSRSVVANGLGTLIERTLYHGWGTVRFDNQSGEWTQYTYTGQYSNALDARDFGLLFYNARWYDPSLGRFASADSLIPDPGNPLDYDRYAYARNNALKYTDPSGHEVCDEDGNCYANGQQTRTARPKPKTALPIEQPNTENSVDPSIKKIEYLFHLLSYTPGWWNGFGRGEFTIFDFFVLILAREFQGFILGKPDPNPARNDQTDFVTDLAHGTAHWFYSQTMAKGLGTEATYSALVSFIAHSLQAGMSIYNLILGSGDVEAPLSLAGVMDRDMYNLKLGNQVASSVIHPLDEEWKTAGIYPDVLDATHPAWWGNPLLLGKNKPTSYLWFLPDISDERRTWYLVDSNYP